MDIGSPRLRCRLFGERDWGARQDGGAKLAGGRAIPSPSLRPPSLFSGLGRSLSGRVLCVAAVLGLALRLVILAARRASSPRSSTSSTSLNWPTNLVRGNGFAWGAGELTSIRPPLYPAVVAAIWRVTGEGSFQVVRALQILIGMLTAWLVYVLGRRVYDEDTGRYAAAAVWLYPTLIFFNFTDPHRRSVHAPVGDVRSPVGAADSSADRDERDRLRRRPRLERAHAQRVSGRCRSCCVRCCCSFSADRFFSASPCRRSS